MTPQEQQLVADLFDRLASLEGQRRDPDAERLIREGLGRAPNSVYALVQTVLVQDETLKRANARIEELERAIAAPAESGSGGFLDGVRNMLGGRDPSRGGSVPSVRPGGQGSSGVWGSRPDAGPPPSQPSPGQPWGNPQGYPQGGYPPAPPPGYPAGYPAGAPATGGHGGSFLGTAAATVAGVVGGAMLLNGIRSMMGGHEGFSPGHDPSGSVAHGGSPWDSGSSHGTGDQGGGNLSQDAGLGDIGGGGHRTAAWDRAGNQDNQDNNDNDNGGFLGGNVDDLAGNQQDDGDFDTGDFDGGDGGDFDTA
jgi:hypothetical protein